MKFDDEKKTDVQKADEERIKEGRKAGEGSGEGTTDDAQEGGDGGE